MNNNDMVSVIIPCYNREKSIVRAVESVLHQTYKNIEVIIVDDCSSDNTIPLLNAKYGADIRVRIFIQEKNAGACAARNRGVKEAYGKYIAFLDSDDEFVADKIEKQLYSVKEHDTPLCASSYLYYRNGKKEIRSVSSNITQREILDELLYCNFITTGTLFGLRECFIQVPFDEELPRYQDWDLVIRLLRDYSISLIQDSTLIQYYQPVSISASTNHSKSLFSLERILNKNEELYKRNKQAYAQILWLIGLHRMCIDGMPYFKYLYKGATIDGTNIRRIGITMLRILGFRKFLESKF